MVVVVEVVVVVVGVVVVVVGVVVVGVVVVVVTVVVVVVVTGRNTHTRTNAYVYIEATQRPVNHHVTFNKSDSLLSKSLACVQISRCAFVLNNSHDDDDERTD